MNDDLETIAKACPGITEKGAKSIAARFDEWFTTAAEEFLSYTDRHVALVAFAVGWCAACY